MSLSHSATHVLIVGPVTADPIDRDWRIIHPRSCPWEAWRHSDDPIFGPDPSDPDRRYSFHRACGVQYEIENLGFDAICDAFGGEPVPPGRYLIRHWASYTNTWINGEEWDSGLELVEAPARTG